jgi:outer membrane immunogenic protein
MLALTFGTGAASAADLYTPPPAPPPGPVYSPAAAYNWNGSYMGLMGGYGWSSANIDGSSYDDNNWQGGIFGGYNFQVSPNWVVGLEGDAKYNGFKATDGAYTVKNDWDATARLRAGYTFDRFMLYGTAGLAVGNVKVSDLTPDSQSKTKVGWTAGLGAEAALTNNLTSRIEYRYTDLGSSTYNDLAGTPDVGLKSSAVLVGVGMKF